MTPKTRLNKLESKKGKGEQTIHIIYRDEKGFYTDQRNPDQTHTRQDIAQDVVDGWNAAGHYVITIRYDGSLPAPP